MKAVLRLAFVALSLPAFASDSPPLSAQILSAQGILSQQSDLHWQVQIPDEHGVQFDGKRIDEIRFSVDSFAQAACKRYEGQNVEVSGEVKVNSVAHGTAALKLQSITLGEPTAETPAESIRKYITKEPDLNEHAPGQPLYRFAYFLVLLDSPRGCERCYVPLLLAPEPLDRAASRKQSINAVWITTYERDSIWQRNGIALLTPEAIEPPSNTLHFRGRAYRYQPALDGDVLRLLDYPMGTIPISRPHVLNREAPGADINDLISGFHTIFRVRERKGGSAMYMSQVGSKPPAGSAPVPEDSGFTSELAVFDDGKVQFRRAPGCTDRFVRSDDSHVVAESWNWRETCPGGGQGHEQSFDFTLTQPQFRHLKDLLNDEAVKGLRECFCNAAPIFDDYEVEIPHQDSIQDILVFAFMPQHFELREHPALTYLICEAKNIEQGAVHGLLPDWCDNLPPLK